jgi:capsular exopolysaccharide synthesis family protein
MTENPSRARLPIRVSAVICDRQSRFRDHDRAAKQHGEKILKDPIIYPTSQDSYVASDDVEIEFSDLLRQVLGVIRRNVLLIACVVAGALLVGIVITLLTASKYEATAQVLIEDRADQIIEGSDLEQAVTGSDTERFLQTQLGLMQSRTLARSVVQAGGFARSGEFFQAFGVQMPAGDGQDGQALQAGREEMAINLLAHSLTVAIPVDSRIANIKITTRSPQLSAKLANLYAAKYVDYNLNQKYDSSSYARKFLSDQLEETRNKLTQSERDLNQYARAAGLIRIENQGDGAKQDSALSVTNSQLVQINNATALATAERIAAENRWNTVADKPALSISEVNSNNAVSQLVLSKANAQAELADELSRHQEGFSTVKAKRAEIAELDSRINAIASSIKRSAQVDYESAVKKENSLNERVASLRNEALKEQDRGVQYSVLKRVADTNRALYESLLSRYNQLNASAGSASNNVAIVDPAIVPGSPSSPNLILNVLISLLAGLLCAAAVVTLKELLDDAIRSPADVEKKLGLSLLGLIPVSKSADVSEDLSDRRSSVSEAYRSLVTNLSYSTAQGLPQVLLVTSSRESEGKSTTARALASDIAMLGKRTLLVDADLRRPTLHRYLNDNRNSGLTDILTGHKSIEEAAYQSPEVPSLSYITGLPMPPDPGLILAGPGLAHFLEEARRQFEVIVLDCPPLLGLSDVPLIANHVDGALFVIDASSFHRGAIKSALRRLGMSNVKILGVALNRFQPKTGSDDYGYYSYNYYTYGAEKG